jgi:hypothetical protein
MSSLVDDVAATLIGRSGERQRVAVDGASALDPDSVGAALAEALRDQGRAAVHVSVNDFLLPASQRFEFGKTDVDSFYLGWRDEDGLRREVLDPAGPTGSGRVLPALWRVDIDRSARADYVTVPSSGFVIVSGQFLLGSGLPFEFAVHLECSAAALSRRTDPNLAWTLPAYDRYAAEVEPAAFADVVVRLEDPRRPAIVERS